MSSGEREGDVHCRKVGRKCWGVHALKRVTGTSFFYFFILLLFVVVVDVVVVVFTYIFYFDLLSPALVRSTWPLWCATQGSD